MSHRDWTQEISTNEWTGRTEVRHVRQLEPANGVTSVYLEVTQVGHRLYWSANVLVRYRPDASRLSFGTYAAIPGALAVAKARATSVARAAIRKAGKPRR